MSGPIKPHVEHPVPPLTVVGGTVPANDAAPEFEIPARMSRFKVEDFDDIEPGSQQWVVKELWPRSGVCFVAGPSKSGKSFWLLDKLVAVTRGQPVLGRKSKKCGLLYIGAEGATGLRNRIKGLRSKTGKLNGFFKFIGAAPNLTDPEDVVELRATLLKAKEAMAAKGVRLGAVGLDTLSASIPGADENTAKDMSPVLDALQRLAADLDLVVIVVAHTGKDEARGLRGWSGLLANADGLILMDAPDEGYRGGTVDKVKDGEDGDKFGFELVRVVIGPDEDGDEITTCLVEDCNLRAKSKVSRRLEPLLDLILRCVGNCLDAGQIESVPAVDGVPPGTKGVRRDVLREKLKREGYTAGTENPDHLRKAMNRHIDKLVGLGRLRGADVVWIVPQ